MALGEVRRPRLPTLFPPVLVAGGARLLPHPVSGRQDGVVDPDLRLQSTVDILQLLNLGKAGSLLRSLTFYSNEAPFFRSAESQRKDQDLPFQR